jgi:HEAT repeat protein
MITNGKLRGPALKRRVFDLLATKNFNQALEALCALPARQAINPLFSFFCSADQDIRWKAITATGAVVANLAAEDMESARVVMRRMIWNLNDESGGIGWGVPEAMGEIMARHEGLAGEYANILVSYAREDGNFLEHEPLQRGVLWGLGRLAQVRPHLLQDLVPHLQRHLCSEDVTLRGLAAWTMGMIGARQARSSLEALVEDQAEVLLYLNGAQRIHRVGELAREALAVIESRIAETSGPDD